MLPRRKPKGTTTVQPDKDTVGQIAVCVRAEDTVNQEPKEVSKSKRHKKLPGFEQDLD